MRSTFERFPRAGPERMCPTKEGGFKGFLGEAAREVSPRPALEAVCNPERGRSESMYANVDKNNFDWTEMSSDSG